MLGIGQIGAIVCSLGLVGRCVLRLDSSASSQEPESMDNEATHPEHDIVHRNHATSIDPLLSRGPVPEVADDSRETQGLLQDEASDRKSYHHLKGSIAGVYSLAGGAGILLLTKVGGLSFDRLSPVAPFYLLALFNILLLIAGVACGISAAVRGQ